MVKVDALRKRDPRAWTQLFAQYPETIDVVVNSVMEEKLLERRGETRYLLSIAGHPEVCTLIGKKTNAIEAYFYREIAPVIPFLTPNCWFCHVSEDNSWVILDESYDDWPAGKWTGSDVETIIDAIASYHAIFWDNQDLETQHGFISPLDPGPDQNISEVRIDSRLADSMANTQLTDETHRIGRRVYAGKSLLSEHALQVSGRLATTMLKAASGFQAIREIGGWPGVFEGEQLAAAADLLDDPMPVFYPLRQLPKTLLHGSMAARNWRLSVLDECHLLDWQNATIGPGINDLVRFTEQFELLERGGMGWLRRDIWPVSLETMEDSYILAMGAKLGSRFNAMAVRQAIPAARCLYVLITWLPFLDDWFRKGPADKLVWHRLNHLNDQALSEAGFKEMVGVRSYLAGVFQRFMIAYRSL